jgi:hypothetical protein
LCVAVLQRLLRTAPDLPSLRTKTQNSALKCHIVYDTKDGTSVALAIDHRVEVCQFHTKLEHSGRSPCLL